MLRSGLGASQIVVSGFPPVDGFPALPQPLRWYLGARARELDRMLREDVEREPGCRFLGLRFILDSRLMAPDGFHPGPRVYEAWGQRVADSVADLLGAGEPSRSA